MNTQKQNRRGYTLIELLVVISLIAVLAALTMAFFPSAAANARESRAAMNVQTWLNNAKQRALRDQVPRGLRLWATTATFGNSTLAGVVTDCQYIEQPDDFFGGFVASYPTPPPGLTPLNTIGMSVDPTNGYGVVSLPNGNFADPNRIYWSVQPGDYLEVLGTGLMHQIVQIGVPNATNTAILFNYVVINPPLPNALSAPTQNYRIVRAPRVSGEEMLKMPEGTVIDLTANNAFPGFANPLPPFDPNSGNGGFVDILFAPSGAVISRGVATPTINLWVRAPDPVNPDPSNPAGNYAAYYRGAPTIIAVFVRTGLVGSYDPLGVADPRGPFGNVY